MRILFEISHFIWEFLFRYLQRAVMICIMYQYLSNQQIEKLGELFLAPEGVGSTVRAPCYSSLGERNQLLYSIIYYFN